MAKLSLKQETVEAFAANATQKAAMIQRRVSQKKNDVIEAVPLLNRMKEKISSFDQKMTDKFGKNYTKTRNILMGIGKFYIAGQIGGPALVALGTINAVKAVKPLIKEAEEQRKEGKVSGLIDYMKKNPKDTAKTLLSASLGAAVIACGLNGALTAKQVMRAGVAALVVTPEVQTLASTAKQWTHGKATFKDVAREAATVSLSMGAFVAGSNWSHGSTDNSFSDHGTASVSSSADMEISHDIAVPISKADKNPLRPKAAGLQMALLKQDFQKETLLTKTAFQKKASDKSK